MTNLDFQALTHPASAAPQDLVPWLNLLSGAVHRASASEPSTNSAICLQKFREMVLRLGDHQEWKDEAVLLDWWLVALGHEGPLNYAWIVGEQLSDRALGEALQEMLAMQGSGIVPALRGPIRRAQVRGELEDFLKHRPRLKKTPGPELLRDVCIQVRELLDADDAGDPLPEIDLLTLDPEEYASTERGTLRLQHKLKVWNSLFKHVSYLQERAIEFFELAATQQLTVAPLSADWYQTAQASKLPKLITAILKEIDQLHRGQDDTPVLLQAETQVSTLEMLSGDADLEHRIWLLAPLDEALTTNPHLSAPSWSTEAHTALDGLRRQIRSLLTQAQALGVDEAIEGLELALEELQGLQIASALESQEIAQLAISEAHADDATRRKSEELAAQQAVLQELGEELDSVGSLDSQIQAASKRLQEIRADLSQRQKHLEMLLVPESHKASAMERLQVSAAALNEGNLTNARRQLAAAEEFIQAARAEAESALLPALNDLSARASATKLMESERKGLQDLLERIRVRAEDDLSYEALLDAGKGFVQAAEANRLHDLPVLCEVGRMKGLMTSHEVHVLAWLDTGIPVDRKRLSRVPELPPSALPQLQEAQLFGALLNSPPVTKAGQLSLRGPILTIPFDSWTDLIPVRDHQSIRVGQITNYAGAHDLSSLSFCQDEEWVLGPLELAGEDADRPSPQDPRGFVARLPVEAFKDRYGLLITPSKRRLIPSPPDLDELLELDDAEPIDHQDAGATEQWLAELLAANAGVDPAAVAKALTMLESGGNQLPRPILRSRVQRLSDFLAVSRDLETERTRAAESYLATEDGKRQVQRAAERLAQRQTEALQEEVARQRAALEAQLQDRRQKLQALDTQLDDAHARERQAKAALESKLNDLRQQVTDAESLLGDRKSKLLVELLGASGPTTQPNSSTNTSPLTATSEDMLTVATLEEAFQHLQAGLDGWQDFDVANLLVTLLTNPWTLLAGPPGVGKSSFARAVLTRLGHGPQSDRYLELVVRRDWHDDAPLFGFWHPEQGRWSPSSEGLVEHLLTAQDDQSRALGGFYPCVLEELNLAPPEHYLARLISALEDRDPKVRLYGATQSPDNASRYPHSFALPGNVRFLGTVNVDETVQSLSPRFLSRAAVIWMAPEMSRLLAPPAVPEVPDRPLSWSSMQALLPCEAPELGPILQVVRYLHDNRVPGAPTPRTIRGMERYLSAGRQLMLESVAQDFQVSQRILPTLRGVGERYREVYDGLAKILRKNNWTQAALRCEEIRHRGEELGDFYDFFHA